jgi:hypothetical protein
MAREIGFCPNWRPFVGVGAVRGASARAGMTDVPARSRGDCARGVFYPRAGMEFIELPKSDCEHPYPIRLRGQKQEFCGSVRRLCWSESFSQARGFAPKPRLAPKLGELHLNWVPISRLRAVVLPLLFLHGSTGFPDTASHRSHW